jgi:hypothetical protein
MEARNPFDEVVRDLIIGVAKQIFPARRQVDGVSLDVPIPDPVVGALDGELEAFVVGAAALGAALLHGWERIAHGSILA